MGFFLFIAKVKKRNEKNKKKKRICHFNLHAKTQGKAPDNWDKRNWADAQNVRSTNSYEQDWCNLREFFQSRPSLLRSRGEACRYTEELNCLHCARSPNHHTPTSWNVKLQRILFFFKNAPASKSFGKESLETLDGSELFRYTNVTNVSKMTGFHFFLKYVVWNCVEHCTRAIILPLCYRLWRRMFCPLINTSGRCHAQFPHIHATNKLQ